MEIRAFNMAILYQFLIKKLNGVSLKNGGNETLRDFVRIYTASEKDDLSANKEYFIGVVSDKGRGSFPTGFKFGSEFEDRALKSRIKDFTKTYSECFSNNPYKQYIKYAIKCDDIACSKYESQKEKYNSNEILLYFVCAAQEANYFIGNKNAYKEIFKIIIKSVDSKESVEQCREKLNEYWNNWNLEEFKSDEALDNHLNSLKNNHKTSIVSVNNNQAILSPRDIAKRWFESKKGTGRYNGYFETRNGTPIHNLRNKLAVDENGEYSLHEILFPNDKEHKDSVNLCGRGGSGKTYQIFHCIEDIYNGKTTDDELNEIDITKTVENVIPIYIPLHSLKDSNDNCIISFLYKEVWANKSSPDDIKIILENNAENVLIFADGLNEITDPNMRKRIARDICNIRQDFRTRFLVSSRIDHTEVFNSLNYGSDQIFTKARVLDLSQKQIDTYFFDVGCVARYRNVPVNTRKLLQTPQGCVMFADYVGNQRKLIKKIESLGQLISDYSRRLLDVSIGIQTEEIEDIMKKIAHYMVLKDFFKISWVEIKELLNNDEIKLLSDNRLNIESVFSSYSDDTSDLFEFSHQNFRDNYCARAFSDKLKSIRTASKLLEVLDDEMTFVNNNITTNDEILELVSSSISGEFIQKIIDLLRIHAFNIKGIYKDNYDFPLSILIKIFAFSHRNCLANLNLSNLNLTQVSLNGYELFDREGHGCINLNGAKISANTFLKAALQTASSTICKYELNEKTYLAAFATTTAMIIDIEENQVEIIRDMQNYGWVNAAVPREYHGQLCIFLGCRNGSVALFHPDKERKFRKEIFIATKDIKTAIKGKGEIETILFPVWNGQEYIVFCNSNGDVFYRELYRSTGEDYKKISLYKNQDELDSILNKFKAKNWYTTCHLSLRKDKVLATFGNKLYSLKFNSENGILLKTEVRIQRKRKEPYLILDVSSTKNYIFINEGEQVSVVAHSSILGIKKTEICVFEISNTLPDSIARHHFNDKSQNNKDFFFHYFSEVPSSIYTGNDAIEAVLIGIEAYHSTSYKQIPQFFEIGMRNGGKNIDALVVTEIRNEQKLATHTGVYYYLKSTGSMVHLATTCDDRSIDLQTPHNEEIATIHKSGAYNGVHSIEILDPTHIVCALYDGNAILLTYDIKMKYSDFDDDDFDDDDFDDCILQDSLGIWSINNVKKIHKDWVWKVCAYNYDNWNNRNNSIITCSYDNTVTMTNLKLNTPPQEIIHGNRPVLDFYISSAGDSIWAISESHVYHCTLVDDKWQCDSTPTPALPNTYLRAIIENVDTSRNNDTPIVFYNKDSGSDGWLGKVINGCEISPFINLGRNVFIRQMSNHIINGYNHLFAAGELNKKAYAAIYKVLSHNEYELVSSISIDDVTGANSFSYVEMNGNKLLIVLSKNNFVSMIKLDDNLMFTSDINKISVPAQPMCIDSYVDEGNNYLIIIGLLNGQIMRLQIEDGGQLSVSEFITTHADLISNLDVNLSLCEFEDGNEKESFKRQLKDYFTI